MEAPPTPPPSSPPPPSAAAADDDDVYDVGNTRRWEVYESERGLTSEFAGGNAACAIDAFAGKNGLEAFVRMRRHGMAVLGSRTGVLPYHMTTYRLR